MAEQEFNRTPRPHAGALTDEAIQTGLLQFFHPGPHYLYGHQVIGRYPLGDALDRLAAPVMLLTYPGDQLRPVSLALKRAHPAFALREIG